MDVWTWVQLGGGLVILVVAAELLVRGASRLATSFGISPLVVGLTVVAFGTSAPELAVSTQAAFAGTADLAVGNIVGSNIFNVLVILGLSAAITPLIVDRQVVRREVPIVVGASLLVWGMAALGSHIGRLEGALLFTGIIGYTVWTIRRSRREVRESMVGLEQPPKPPGKQIVVDLALVAVGLGGLMFGSRWLVEGAVAIATAFGVSELVIGLTIVAAGTSLPEVAASVVAAVRGQRDIAVGNVVGSNIFNLLSVLGGAALLAPDGVAVSLGALTFDLPIMVAVAIACLPLFLATYRLERWQGVVLLAWYAAYLGYLVLDATDHHALDELQDALAWFVLPITVLTVALVMVRGVMQRRAQSSG